jgi:hypothetical protein
MLLSKSSLLFVLVALVAALGGAEATHEPWMRWYANCFGGVGTGTQSNPCVLAQPSVVANPFPSTAAARSGCR